MLGVFPSTALRAVPLPIFDEEELTLRPRETFEREADATWRADWRYLATPLAQRVEAINADTPGLALPKPVIDKLYWANARRFFRLGKS